MRRRSGCYIAALVLLAGCDVLPNGATVQGQEMHQVWIVFLLASACVAAIVWGLIAWCILRWHDRGEATGEPPQFKSNNILEIAWTVIPLIVVAGLFAYTYVAERHVEGISDVPAVTVDVTGFRWSWRFYYPDLGVVVAGTTQRKPELVLPLNRTVAFNVHSADVDHSFAVPAFLFKRDAIPGLDNHFDWTPTRSGVFRGECGEFCGMDHTNMTFTVRVVSDAAFRTWAAAHRSPAVAQGVSR